MDKRHVSGIWYGETIKLRGEKYIDLPASTRPSVYLHVSMMEK